MNKIQIYLNDKKDYISKFNQERISKELYGYIKNEVKLININKKINIEITSKFSLTDKEKETLALNIKNTSEEELNDIKVLEEKVILKDLLLLLRGIIIIFIYFILKNTPIISEVILIIGWLFIWEAIARLLFAGTERKIQKQRLKQIIYSDIDFKN